LVPVRFRFFDTGTVWTVNGLSVYSSHSRKRKRSFSESSAGCEGGAVGDLRILLGVFLALAILGVPLGVCAVFDSRLAADFNGVALAFEVVAFLGIVRLLAASSRTARMYGLSVQVFEVMTLTRAGDTRVLLAGASDIQ
jgi:hypothetical protein